jgi:hypothetical protein
MIKELTKFQKEIVRAMLRQNRKDTTVYRNIPSIALKIKRRYPLVLAYVKQLRDIKIAKEEFWNSKEQKAAKKEKRKVRNYNKIVNEIKPNTSTTGLDLSFCGDIDIETGVWKTNERKEAKMLFSTNVLCVSYYDPKVGIHTFNSVKAAIKFIIRKTTVKNVFAHNLRGFESLYLINEIRAQFDSIHLRTQGKNANPFLFSCVKGDRHLTFQDSIAIIPYALADITSEKGFDTATKKGDLKKGKEAPYYSIKEIKEYNRSDCIGLYQAMLLMSNEIDNAFAMPLKNTTSSLGFAVIRKHYLDEKIIVDEKINKLLRSAYHGGAVQILSIPHPNKDVLILEVDINSSYPSAMRMPIPFPPYKTVNKPDVKIVFEEEGFSYGRVTFPKDVRFPILASPMKTTNGTKKLIFPGGSFKGMFAHPSLRFAIEKQGAKFVPEYTVIGTTRTFLKKFAEDLYGMRQKAGNNKAKRYTYKILLNGSYGRWGISDEQTQWIVNNMTPEEWLTSGATIDENFVAIKVKNPHTQAVVSVAAYITDYGRVNLWAYLYALLQYVPLENICYFDTDAIFYLPDEQPSVNEWTEINAHENDKAWIEKWTEVNMPMFTKGISPYLNDALGNLKVEMVGKRSDIVTSKVYKVTKLDGTCIYRAKGFNTPEVDTPENMDTWWRDLKSGKPIEMRGLLTFVTSLNKQIRGDTKEMVTVKEEVTRQLRNAYDKRVIVPLVNHPLLIATTKPLEKKE